jgi:hypothetical protein
MTFFPEHAFHGIVMHALLRPWWIPITERWKLRLWIVLGGVAGMLPDALDWLASVLCGIPRRQLYGELHHGPLGMVLCILPGFWTHVVSDIPFHAHGGAWFPDMWWLMVLIDGIFVCLAIYLWKKGRLW